MSESGHIGSSGMISVIVPMYNSEQTIKSTLESVISQTFTNFECIVVNDGSKDKSLKIVESLAINDPRIKIISSQNNGVSSARNLGIAFASGEFIAFLDSDDLWAPTKLQSQVKILNSSPEIDAVLCDYCIGKYDTNARVRVLRRVRLPGSEKIAEPWLTFEGFGPLMTSTILLRKKCLGSNTLSENFDPLLSTAADIDFYCRFLLNRKVTVIPQTMVFYALRKNQMHLNPVELLSDYPKMLDKFIDMGLRIPYSKIMGNLYIMASILYLRRLEFVRFLVCVANSFHYSRRSFFIVPLRITFKRMISFFWGMSQDWK